MNIRSYLLLMALAILAPITVFSILALNMLLDSERDSALASVQETARVTALTVDRELLSAEAALTVLASSINLAAGDMPAFYTQAKTADRGPGAWTILFDRQGRQIVNTIAPFGTSLPLPAAPQRVERVLQTQQTFVSDLLSGPVTNRLVSTLNIPVIVSEERQYVLAAVFEARFFEKLLKEQTRPPSWIIGLIDNEGRFIARSHRFDETTGQPARPELVNAAKRSNVGQIRHTTLEGTDSYDVFTHSTMSGWTIAIAAPVSVIDASAKQAILMVSLGLVAALTLAGAGAALFGGYLFQSINRASRSALMLGMGEIPPDETSHVFEIRQLHGAISSAAQVLAREQDARVQAESERERLLASEMEARKRAETENDAKDQFLAMLGHEIRNPLSAIVTAAALISIGTQGNPRLSRTREILDRQSTSLTKIVDDLLDMTRVSMGKVNLRLERLDLAQVAADCAEGLRAAGRTRNWAFSINVCPAWVDADRTRLEQVINNLLLNATKYTPSGGAIDVSVQPQGTQAVLTIRDSGIGISAPLLPKIFDLFVQAPGTLDRAQGGLGIGLTLVRQLVVLHHGTVGAHSDGIGLGSTFTVRLPLFAEPTMPGTSTILATQDKSCRVLLIEDNADGREMVAMALSSHGHQVFEAADGNEGIALIARERPDVAVIDIGLPGMSGFEVARHLRADPANDSIRLIALTGYGQDADRVRALKAGFDRHLVKPVNIPELLHWVGQGRRDILDLNG